MPLDETLQAHVLNFSHVVYLFLSLREWAHQTGISRDFDKQDDYSHILYPTLTFLVWESASTERGTT